MKSFKYKTLNKSHKDFCVYDQIQGKQLFDYSNHLLNDLSEHDFNINSFSLDLIELAFTIYHVDRYSYVSNDDTKRNIELNISLRHPELFEEIIDELNHLLFWLTGDNWEISLNNLSTTVVRQTVCEYKINDQLKVLLWSGGLDALAGLYNEYQLNQKAKFIPVHVGINNVVQNKQAKVSNLLKKKVTNINIRPVTVSVSPTKHSVSYDNDKSRTRGLCFLLVGSAVSLWYSTDQLFMYENGYGAFNIPFRMSETAKDHSKSAHPKLLIEVSKIIENLTGNKFWIKNPYIFTTKAEMVSSLVKDGHEYIILETISCDSKIREVGADHCGVCSSCILRRSALLSSGIDKSIEEYQISIHKKTRIFKCIFGTSNSVRGNYL